MHLQAGIAQSVEADGAAKSPFKQPKWHNVAVRENAEQQDFTPISEEDK